MEATCHGLGGSLGRRGSRFGAVCGTMGTVLSFCGERDVEAVPVAAGAAFVVGDQPLRETLRPISTTSGTRRRPGLTDRRARNHQSPAVATGDHEEP